jgi:Centromere DNA-binding protein complex CBF3 subunit, domain 2
VSGTPSSAEFQRPRFDVVTSTAQAIPLKHKNPSSIIRNSAAILMKYFTPHFTIHIGSITHTSSICPVGIAYLSYLPLSFMRSTADFPKEEKGYFLPRAQEVPEESLSSKVWPEADIWLQRMESYHPTSPTMRSCVDLAGSGFLCRLRQLLLQDSVVLRKQFPSNINRKCYSKLCFSGNCKIQAAKMWYV